MEGLEDVYRDIYAYGDVHIYMYIYIDTYIYIGIHGGRMRFEI